MNIDRHPNFGKPMRFSLGVGLGDIFDPSRKTHWLNISCKIELNTPKLLSMNQKTSTFADSVAERVKASFLRRPWLHGMGSTSTRPRPRPWIRHFNEIQIEISFIEEIRTNVNLRQNAWFYQPFDITATNKTFKTDIFLLKAKRFWWFFWSSSTQNITY